MANPWQSSARTSPANRRLPLRRNSREPCNNCYEHEEAKSRMTIRFAKISSGFVSGHDFSRADQHGLKWASAPVLLRWQGDGETRQSAVLSWRGTNHAPTQNQPAMRAAVD